MGYHEASAITDESRAIYRKKGFVSAEQKHLDKFPIFSVYASDLSVIAHMMYQLLVNLKIFLNELGFVHFFYLKERNTLTV